MEQLDGTNELAQDLTLGNSILHEHNLVPCCSRMAASSLKASTCRHARICMCDDVDASLTIAASLAL